MTHYFLPPMFPRALGAFFGWFVALVMLEALPARAQSSATQDELNGRCSRFRNRCPH